MVIDHGAVPIFVKLLGSPSDDVREQVCTRQKFLDMVFLFSLYLYYIFVSHFASCNIANQLWGERVR